MTKDWVAEEFPDFHLGGKRWAEGINEIAEKEFVDVASELIHWCKQLEKDRVFVVTHDGTMTAYRQWMERRTLTREDFPKEAGWIRMNV
ncbi:hypothetical protein [Halobacillus sp. GSS1]|uniref:hypothetical protein n=1 Tax=Halobacillus sp. GSS1 TaxID=2815919 RepID=UPI001F5CD89B|nr:hypothetical protein [Halobacillus sp. GSS1]